MKNEKPWYVPFNIVVKSVIFLNVGTFTRISSVQDEINILKWNDL